MVGIPVTGTLHLDQATQVMQVAAMLAREWEAVLCGHLAHVGRHHRVTLDMVGDSVKDLHRVGLHLHRVQSSEGLAGLGLHDNGGMTCLLVGLLGLLVALGFKKERLAQDNKKTNQENKNQMMHTIPRPP